jgi:hypothetical protein
VLAFKSLVLFRSKGTSMLTHAQLAARLLRDAAMFFRRLAEDNPSLAESMQENAGIYDQVADMVEKSPTEVIEIEGDK